MSEKEDAVTGLILLKKRLLTEIQYRGASPSMRLLNEIMSLMPLTADVDEAEQDEVIKSIAGNFSNQPAERSHCLMPGSQGPCQHQSFGENIFFSGAGD